MSAMRRVALRDVATIERDITEASQIKTGTPFVGLENIESGGQFVNVRSVGAGELASSKFAFTPRHVLYGKLRPYLAKIARPDFEGICSTDILPLLPGPELDRGYLCWLLLTPEMVQLAASRAAGANLPRLSPHALGEMTIPLPPLPEQRRIAEILDKADALRAKRRAALAQLDTLTQSIFLDMFGDPFTHRGDSVPLGQVAEILMGQSPPGASYNVVGDGTPLLNGPTEFGSRYPVETQWTRDPTRLCAKDDILFCVRGATAGRLNRADKVYCLGRGLAAIRPRAGAPVSAEFLFAVLARYYDYFQAKGVGSTFINISRQEIESVPIPRSTRVQADTLTRQIAAAEKAKEVHFSSQVRLQALFSSLQYRALTGGL